MFGKFAKRIIPLSLILLFGSQLFAEQKKVTIRVDGLSCPFCAYGLEKKLKSIKGVEKIQIKVNDAVAILTFKEGAQIDEKLIAKKVKEAGFTPGEVKTGTEKEQKLANTFEKAITLRVDGMNCDGCVARITKALEALECVKNVKVDLKSGKATFICTDENVDATKFVKIINKLGYKAKLEKK